MVSALLLMQKRKSSIYNFMKTEAKLWQWRR